MKAGFQITTPGKVITLDKAIEVMVHQITANEPSADAYRLVYESLAVSIHLASIGTSVYETIESNKNNIYALEDCIRTNLCTIRNLKLVNSATSSLIQACRNLHDPRLAAALRTYDSRTQD